MKRNSIWWVLSITPILALPSLVSGQEESANSREGLRQLSEPRSSKLQRVYIPESNEKPAVDREAWSRRVTVADLDEREHHLDELIRRAQGDDHLRLMLEEWAVDTSESERAWTARMALRELRREPAVGTLSTLPGFGNASGFTRMMEMQRELEDAILRMHDPHFGGWLQGFGHDLDMMFTPGQSLPDGRSQSFSLEVGPDGVRCEVSDCVDGQEINKEYTADTYEELLEANPELREHLGKEDSPTLGLGLGLEPEFLLAQPHGESLIEPLAPMRTDRLGIETTAPDPRRVKEFGLQEGQGLLVVRVRPRSIASILEIGRGDIVIEIDGRPIFGGLDVRQVLSERARDAELSVVVVNSRGQRKELLWKPDF